jgi:hypothetical protein
MLAYNPSATVTVRSCREDDKECAVIVPLKPQWYKGFHSLLIGHSSYFPLYLYDKEFYNSFNVFKFFEKEVEKIWEIKVARKIKINP